jgi:hypothetical protein
LARERRSATSATKAARGIRARLRPLERAAFFKGYAEKQYKNLIMGGSGAFGNAATQLEAMAVKGGTYAYGSYPDLDEMFKQQGVGRRPDRRSTRQCKGAYSRSRLRRARRRNLDRVQSLLIEHLFE